MDHCPTILLSCFRAGTSASHSAHLPDELDLIVKVFRTDAGTRVDEEDEVGLGAASQPRHAGLEDGAQPVGLGRRGAADAAVSEF